MAVFTSSCFDNHEKVLFCSDSASGLRGIIAIHDRTLGPACGGCRVWSYATEQDAIDDVLTLSRGMTYKNALAGLPFGGGKAVIWTRDDSAKTTAMLRAFGRVVDRLGGRYITAEDVGMSPQDMDVIHTQTRYVIGLENGPAASGNPAPWTARGVFAGIRAALTFRTGSDDLHGRHIAIQGLGQVGFALGQRLFEAGATLSVSDLDPERCQKAQQTWQAEVCAPETIHRQKADVFAPCALGGSLSQTSIEDIGAPIIAGSANNQLADPSVGDTLHQRGLLYAPDYVINAGGVINVAGEALGHYDKLAVEQRVDAIADTLSMVFDRSTRTNQATSLVADSMAEEILMRARLDRTA